jgi:BolA family transcriptional regulator, general stress-responsive regulator
MASGPIGTRMNAKLAAAFTPESLDVLNESHMHAGHQEAFDGKGETHFRIRIVADAFSGMSRIDRHRAVNAVLADELAGDVHALAIEARAPGEPTRHVI